MSDETKCWRGWLAETDSGKWYASDGHSVMSDIEVYVRPVPDHGLTPGTRVLDRYGREGEVLCPHPDHPSTMIWYPADRTVRDYRPCDLTPISDEPRTYTEDEIREVVHGVFGLSTHADAIIARLRGTP